MAFADLFVPELDNCNEILNAGSLLLVQKVICPNSEPIVHTLTPDADVLAGVEEIVVTVDTAAEGGVRIRKGSVLDFNGNTAVVTEETVVTTSTTLPVESLENAITTTDTATTWGMLQILSPTNIPTNIEAQEVNRTDLSNTLQGSMVKTKIENNPQITAINNLNDRALYEYILDAAKTTNSVYALIVRSSTIHTFGRALISGWNDDGNIEEISRPQFTVKYQAPFGVSLAFKFETSANQTALNNIRSLAGLAPLTV